MVDLTPLPGTAEDGSIDAVLDTVQDRIAARDTYIASSGGGIRNIRSYVVSHQDGDEIQLRGGETGASFQGFLFWSKVEFAITGKNLDLNKRLSKEEGNQFAEATTRVLGQTARDQENIDLAFDALRAIRKQQDDAGINVIHEDELISLNPGDTFTVKNKENAIADEFFTEREGFIQWSYGFQVIETQFNEFNDSGADFGAKIERLTEFKGIATGLFKLIRVGRGGGPVDFTIAPEEEGGFQIEEETILGGIRDALGDFGESVKDVAAMAAIILGSILAIFLMITMRKPLQAAAGGFTEFVKESVSR